MQGPTRPPAAWLYISGVKKISGPRNRSRSTSAEKGVPARPTPSYRRLYFAGSKVNLSCSLATSAVQHVAVQGV
jgi:hypothetical protein